MAAFGLLCVIFGAAQWINGARLGRMVRCCSACCCGWARCSSVPRGDRRKRRRPVRPQGRPVVPLEHELVHLLRSDVLRRLLHRPVVGARALAAGARQPGQRPAVARLQGRVAHVAAGATASPAGIVEPFQTVGPFWLPTINTALLLSSGVTLTIAHHALRANHRGQTMRFMWLTVLLGAIFLACRATSTTTLHRAEPQAQLGRLRLHLLHADRLPRLARVHRHADAAVHHAAAA